MLKGLPKLPFVVLDMNQCRSEEAVAGLLRDFNAASVSVMLPLVAIFELSKGTVGTLSASLTYLRHQPEAVTIGIHSEDVRDRERRFRSPVLDLVDRRYTANIRSLLHGINMGEEIDPLTVTNVASFMRATLDVSRHPSAMRSLVEAHRRDLPNPRANIIRAALQRSDRAPFREYLLEKALGGPGDVAILLRALGYGYKTSAKLVAYPSFSALFALAYTVRGLCWRIMGGAETCKDGLLENDGLDLEYVLLALYGRDYVTVDAGARTLYEDMLFVCRAFWPGL
jgi:hypothetical protein